MSPFFASAPLFMPFSLLVADRYMFFSLKFVHEVINAVTKPFDFSLYPDVDAADLEPIVEACKLFIIQIINLGLTKEQVRHSRPATPKSFSREIREPFF